MQQFQTLTHNNNTHSPQRTTELIAPCFFFVFYIASIICDTSFTPWFLQLQCQSTEKAAFDPFWVHLIEDVKIEVASSLFLCVPQKAPSMPPSARCPHYTNHAHRCKRANPDWLGYSHLVIPEANPRCYTDWNLRNIFVNQREKSNPGGVLSPYLVYQANATSHFPPISYALSNDIFLLSIHSFHRGVKQSLSLHTCGGVHMYVFTYILYTYCMHILLCMWVQYVWKPGQHWVSS